MALKSMTGFGRAIGADDGLTWAWEIRTVNGRGRDVRLRVPAGLDALESQARALCARYISRGNCTANLQIKRLSGTVQVSLDEEVLAQVLGALQRAAVLTQDTQNIDPPRLDGLLGLRGVLDVREPREDEAATKARIEKFLTTLETALTQMDDSRRAEGARLTQVLNQHLETIKAGVADAKTCPGRAPAQIAEKLRVQISNLLSEDVTIDENRLLQEAALLATKADVEEEIKRLEAHCAAAQTLLADTAPVGRRFEFLIQEFNREANTLCSKSNDLSLTQIGLGLKAAIDQMREQALNIE